MTRALYVIRHIPSKAKPDPEHPEKPPRAICGAMLEDGPVTITKNLPLVAWNEEFPNPGEEAPCLPCGRKQRADDAKAPRRAARAERRQIRAEKKARKAQERRVSSTESDRAFAWLDEDRKERR